MRSAQFAQALARLDRTAAIAVLLTPAMLMHAHAFAEATMGVTSVCFLARSAIARDWGWVRFTWVRIGFAWWAWVIVCSLPIPALGLGPGGGQSLVQAIAMGRFLIFAAALENVALNAAWARRWLQGIIVACAAYIALHSLFQAVTASPSNVSSSGIRWPISTMTPTPNSSSA